MPSGWCDSSAGWVYCTSHTYRFACIDGTSFRGFPTSCRGSTAKMVASFQPQKGRARVRKAKTKRFARSWLAVGLVAGGIPGFRIELCCFYHPLTWPLCVILCFLCFASCSVAILIMTHKMSSCMLFPLLVAIPLLCVFFVLVWLWLCVFCLLGFFCFWLWFFGFLLGQLAGLRTGPLPVLLWLSTSRQPCMTITIHLFAAIECV